jgi:hypothetical protein
VNDSPNVKLLPTIPNDKNYKISNQRPDDFLEEREVYEKLCRQNGTQVK